MHRFIRRNLDPASRLGEVLFGLIMALGFTASARLGLDEADNHTLFVSILGCNLAWAIVDAVMYVLTEVFERGRRLRLVREVQARHDDQEAIAVLASELDQYVEGVTTEPMRRDFYAQMLDVIRSSAAGPASVRMEDLRGGLAVALIILLATFPVVIPFLAGFEPDVAVRVSNTVAIVMLFVLGLRWGRLVGASPLGIGTGLMTIGVALVLITVALGG